MLKVLISAAQIMTIFILVAANGCVPGERQVPVKASNNDSSTMAPEPCTPASIGNILSGSSAFLVSNISSVNQAQKYIFPIDKEEKWVRVYWVTRGDVAPEINHFLVRQIDVEIFGNDPSSIKWVSHYKQVSGVYDINGNPIPVAFGEEITDNCESKVVQVGRWAIVVGIKWMYTIGTEDFSRENRLNEPIILWKLPVDENDIVDITSLTGETRTTMSLDELSEVVKDYFEANPNF